jgi:subtilisin family serine protease
MPTLEREKRLKEAERSLTPRALARRRNVLGSNPVRVCDLAPSRERLQAIEATGCRIVGVVRYLNAVVVVGSDKATSQVSRLGFVKEVRPVMAYASDVALGGRAFLSALDDRSEVNQGGQECPPSKGNRFQTDDDAAYGRSLTQSLLVNLTRAHESGYKGRGILIGVQDTGFDNLRHRCFDYLNVIAEWDFLNNDGNVGNQGDNGSGAHGTRTLSIIAGLDSGRFIGAAPLADFVLTKTENSDAETPVEEDYWIQGLWFHDSLGVDVLSSSLSYRQWYDYLDLDGETALTTRAADSAAAAGIVIVNSMGNTGLSAYPQSKMGAPADARLVISVAGMRRDSTYWTSSSQGPTFDGRLKPDVVALGSGVYTAGNADDSNYFSRSGTSFSTPMVAGIAALVLQANPDLTAVEVMTILHSTSSMADRPDTLMGYGIVDALAAVRLAEAMAVSVEPLLPVNQNISIFPNPANGVVTVIFRPGGHTSGLTMIDQAGREVSTIAGSGSGPFQFRVTELPAGSYWVGSQANGWGRLVVVK